MSRGVIVFVLVCLVITTLKGEESRWKRLGCAEKVWVILHPFSAKKAWRLSQLTLRVTDTIKTDLNHSFNGSGSHVDAFKHAYWMGLLSARIGPKRALWLGRAHEKKNKKDFENDRSEDGALVDSVTIKMDLLNNEFGAKVGEHCYDCSYEQLKITIIEALKRGELKIINHSPQGDFLDKHNNKIQDEEWQGKYKNERLLVPSNIWL